MNKKNDYFTNIKNYLKTNYKRELLNLLLLFIGSTISGIAINAFYIPLNFTMGGVSGIARILDYIFRIEFISLGTWIFLLNIPLFYLSYKEFGISFTLRSVIGTFSFSTFIDIVALYDEPIIKAFHTVSHNMQIDQSIYAIVGGAIFGIGLGIIFYGNYTTGGTDILVFVARKYIKKLSLGTAVYMIDFIIISTTLLVYDPKQTGNPVILAMYSLVSLIIAAKAIDFILEGINDIRAAYIISDNSEQIANAILYDLNRGVTSLKGQGFYTRKDKNVLLCVLSTKQISHLKRIVSEIDKKAFVIVSPAHEVLGEGFESEHSTFF